MSHWDRKYFGSLHKGKMIFFLNKDVASEYELSNDAFVYALEPHAAIQMLFAKEYEELKKIIKE